MYDELDTERKPVVRPWVYVAIPVLILLILARVVYGPFVYQDVTLLNAVVDDDKEVVIELLNAGVDIRMQDIQGTSVLHQTRNAAMAEFLLEQGADLNAQRTTGDTPLHTAVNERAIEVAEVLIRRGAELNIVNRYGFTPLDFSTYSDRITQMIRRRGGKLGEELKP